jgi:hypothetical protein
MGDGPTRSKRPGESVTPQFWTCKLDSNRSSSLTIRDEGVPGPRGLLHVDDFHGTQEWAVFLASMKFVFPDRPIVDIPDSDPIFHVIYDLDNRYQVPGAQYLRSGRTYESDGYEARWRGIYDDHGRLMVAICHNMDLVWSLCLVLSQTFGITWRSPAFLR